MKTVDGINNKIKKLEEERERLQKQEALRLLKETKKILPEGFTTEMMLAVFEDSMQQLTPEKQEAWKKSSEKFLPKRKTKTAKTNPEK